MEVGEYIRTKQGYIAKIISQDVYIELDKPVDFRQTSGVHYAGQILFDEDDMEITKHSKNIIDLIEVGDYVNRERVMNIMDNGVGTEVGRFIAKEYIDTILTHEMYEQNCYKVGDIE